MNILVTGSAGFIGSAFVRMLLGKPRAPELGHPSASDIKIVSLDLLTYAGDLRNLEPVSQDQRHTFIQGDISNVELVQDIVVKYSIDAIINFAAESHVDRSIDGSEIFARTNILGTINLLEVARIHGLKFLQVSTDEVYGALGETGRFTEDYPLSPNSPYSASKAAADCFVRSYVHTHNLDAIVTRCSNNYGPYQHPEKLLPLAILRLLNGGRVPVYGDGLNIRDWLHVDDHAEGIWLAFTKGRPGEVYNFGGYGECTNLYIIKELAKLIGRDEPYIEFVEDRKGHDWRYSVDSRKATSKLGWCPRWTLENGIKDLVEWYRSNEVWWKPKVVSESLFKLASVIEQMPDNELKERTAKSQLTDAGLDIYSSIESSLDDTVIERLSDNTLIQLIEHYKFLSSSEARNICLMAKELLHLRKLENFR